MKLIVNSMCLEVLEPIKYRIVNDLDLAGMSDKLGILEGYSQALQ